MGPIHNTPMNLGCQIMNYHAKEINEKHIFSWSYDVLLLIYFVLYFMNSGGQIMVKYHYNILQYDIMLHRTQQWFMYNADFEL